MHLVMFFLFFGCGIFAVFSEVLWVWMMIDCAVNESSEGNDKIVWILIILFTNILGALLYFFLRRPERKAVSGH